MQTNPTVQPQTPTRRPRRGGRGQLAKRYYNRDGSLKSPAEIAPITQASEDNTRYPTSIKRPRTDSSTTTTTSPIPSSTSHHKKPNPSSTPSNTNITPPTPTRTPPTLHQIITNLESLSTLQTYLSTRLARANDLCTTAGVPSPSTISPPTLTELQSHTDGARSTFAHHRKIDPTTTQTVDVERFKQGIEEWDQRINRHVLMRKRMMYEEELEGVEEQMGRLRGQVAGMYKTFDQGDGDGRDGGRDGGAGAGAEEEGGGGGGGIVAAGLYLQN